jgi:para-nitrobenzyl esterase
MSSCRRLPALGRLSGRACWPGFEPVIEGDILPALPLDGLRAGAGRDVDILIGTNTDEQRFFMVPTGAVGSMDDPVLQAAAAAYGLGENALPTYRANRPGASAGDVPAAVSGDWFFRIPALRVAEARTQSATWVYEFAWTTPQHGGRLGACHHADVAFVFDRLQSEGAGWLLGSELPQSLADTMHRTWVSFASTGDPRLGPLHHRRPGNHGLQHPQRTRAGPARRRAPPVGWPCAKRKT